MPTSVAHQLQTRGFAHLRANSNELASIDAFASLGDLDNVEGLDSIQTLTPKRVANAPPNTYSGNYGIQEFPLHTDLAHWAIPPRYLALRCVRGSASVATRIIDSNIIIDEFGIGSLRMTLVRPRRPMGNGRQLLRLIELENRDQPNRFRWDSLYLKPATANAEIMMKNIHALLLDEKPKEIFLSELGDSLIIDNWRMLHGRSAVTGDSTHRCIERAYLGAVG